jgi:hypothetical protein
VPLYDKYSIRVLFRYPLFILYCLLTSVAASGQSGKAYSIHFTDTLTAAQSFLLYNTIQIQNLTPDSLQLKVLLLPAEGWNIISQKEYSITIPGRQQLSIPVTLKKRTGISIIWQRVNISVVSFSGETKRDYSFCIYTDPFSKFSVTNIYNGLSLIDSRSIYMYFILKNTGNSDGNYHITFQNEKLGLDHHQVIFLNPGKDSVIKYIHHIPSKLWKQFAYETVSLTIADSFFITPKVQIKERFIRTGNNNAASSNIYFDYFDIYRTDSVFSMHKTDYSYFNLGLESGFIGSSRQVSYYGALRLSYDISKTSKFSFDYRSRQFGIYNTIDRDVFTIGLKTKHWKIKVGKISNSMFFLTYGNGAEVGYAWKKNNTITLFGVKHTPGFHTTNDNAGLLLKYKLGNVILNHDLLYNSDSASHIQSGIFNTQLQWRTKNIDLEINGGLGTENNKVQNRDNNILKEAFGGYRIAFKLKSFSFNSQYKVYGKYFPGLYAGSKAENHGISFRAKKFSAETYYQVNITNNSYFKDTLYNMDIMTFNTIKYGLKLSLITKRSYCTLGYGWLSQSGQQAYSFTPKYQFIEMQYNLRGKKYFNMSLSTYNGYANQNKYSVGPVYFTQNSLNMSYKNFGINTGFTSIPVIDKLKKAVYNNTIYGGPSLNSHFGKYLNVGLQYNLSKTLYDNKVNSFAGINMVYNNEKARTNIRVNISSPLQKANEKNINPFKYGYVSISLAKNFNIPFIFKRKYHRLETVFVEDQNSNGIADANENRIPNVAFAINKLHFISNRFGVAQYMHIDKGDYTVDFSESQLRGLIPIDGPVQIISSEKDKSNTILFSKSKVINGHIEILQDSTAEELFLINNIKIIALDRFGKKYTTSTDAAGNYFINLPAGVYTVSLNQDAFNQNYRPDKMNAEVNLIKTENATINFVIKGKRRPVRLLDVNPGKVINTKQPVEKKSDLTKPKPAKPKH